MAISHQRQGLEDILSLLDAGQVQAARDRVRELLAQLGPDTLLTTTQAAAILGIRSVNTLKMLVKKEGLETVMHGNRTMIPLREIERMQERESVRGIRASDRGHDKTQGLGADEGLSVEELEALRKSRPGRPPWTSE